MQWENLVQNTSNLSFQFKAHPKRIIIKPAMYLLNVLTSRMTNRDTDSEAGNTQPLTLLMNIQMSPGNHL